jgi:hypothetical protein
MRTLSRRWIFTLVALWIVVVAGVTLKVGTQAAEVADRDVIVVRGKVAESQQFKIEDLRKLPRTEIEATDRKGEKVKYAGVAVSELLQKSEWRSGKCCAANGCGPS